MKGQETAKRALEIAAAGGHNLLMSGPPGAGKSLLASCLPGILPPLDAAEALEVSMVASVAGTLAGGRLTRTRPFRAPHHSASMAALVGGGLKVKPGEVSLAHLGVLFLDELPEFQRAVLDSLRQPLETGTVSVARANAHVTFPARVQLIAAMNPCRCGHLGDSALACARAPRCAADYQARVSGPLLDRIDLHVEVAAVTAADLVLPPPAEGSAEVAARVAAARAVQVERYAGRPERTNAEIDGALLEAAATPDEPGRKLLAQASEAMRLSARGYTRVLRVARTIADLAGSGGRRPHPCRRGAQLPPPGAPELKPNSGLEHCRRLAHLRRAEQSRRVAAHTCPNRGMTYGLDVLPLTRYADFQGRSRRLEYWMFALLQIILVIVFYVLLFGMIGGSGALVTDPELAEQQMAAAMTGGASILFIVFGLIWLILLGLIPIVGGLIVLVFMLLPGTVGPNRYGDDPKDV